MDVPKKTNEGNSSKVEEGGGTGADLQKPESSSMEVPKKPDEGNSSTVEEGVIDAQLESSSTDIPQKTDEVETGHLDGSNSPETDNVENPE